MASFSWVCSASSFDAGATRWHQSRRARWQASRPMGQAGGEAPALGESGIRRGSHASCRLVHLSLRCPSLPHHSFPRTQPRDIIARSSTCHNYFGLGIYLSRGITARERRSGTRFGAECAGEGQLQRECSVVCGATVSAPVKPRPNKIDSGHGSPRVSNRSGQGTF